MYPKGENNLLPLYIMRDLPGFCELCLIDLFFRKIKLGDLKFRLKIPPRKDSIFASVFVFALFLQLQCYTEYIKQ